MGNVRLNRMIAWSLLIVAVLIAVAGVRPIFDLYAKIWWFDEAVHFFFSFSATLVLALYAYGALLTGRRHEVLLVLTVAGLGLALGTLWEMGEWTYDLFTPGNSILGKRDTMIDLTADLIGGALAGILGVAMINKSRPPRIE